eukprot:1591189-Pyramimonas_sp.AAC.1
MEGDLSSVARCCGLSCTLGIGALASAPPSPTSKLGRLGGSPPPPPSRSSMLHLFLDPAIAAS